MGRRIATTAAALAVFALLWTSTVVAYSRCAFSCEMPSDQPACPLCEQEPPADHPVADVAIDRSCCDQQFRSEHSSLLEPEGERQLTGDQLLFSVVALDASRPATAMAGSAPPRGPPPAPRWLSEKRTTVL
ncbi:MAG: hypothetical protein KJO07_04920, partial [Deltaproteobacteria bacterium]|nr:hypothetical protein [Deltaproteobacteria bacterium]